MSIIETAVAGTIGGPAGIALSVLGGAKKAIGSAVDWVTGNAAHLLLALLAVSLAWGWLGHHNAAKWERFAHSTETRRKAENWDWAAIDKINHGSILLLTTTLDRQSGMIRTWAATAARKQDAAQAALNAARARGVHTEALAAAIDAERALGGSGGPECRTGKAVLAAKGEL